MSSATQPRRLHVVTDVDQPERVDAETVVVEGVVLGPSADAADVPITLSWGALTSTDTGGRAPIVPAWLADPATRGATLRAIAGNLRYHLFFHALRSPRYGAKVAWYAPRGALRVVGSLVRWATAEEGNWSLRQHAASTNDAYTWQALNRTRSKEAKGRWHAVAAVVLAALAGAAWLLSDRMPAWATGVAVAALVLVMARVGRPADRPITDRVTPARRFTRLTAEMVRDALVKLGLPAMREPAAVEFVHPGIHRDGPGWLARVNLPGGLEVTKVLDRRPGLSSALRLPVDQVWPAAGPDHAGQLDLWVGYQPASKMGQPRWSLAEPNARASVFDLHEFGTDERGRPVTTTLFARSFLLGGQPGSGKSYAARALVTIALLDPTAEVKIAEFKGTGDFIDLEPVCSTYVVGVDDQALDLGAGILRWGLAEAERRGRRILAAKRRGDAPHGKVTPELSGRPGSGLHPVVILIDEVHELFAARPQAADDAERLIKRARALNMQVILATQIPDKSSLPPNIVRCVTNRWCLSVAGQVENDMILGTGAYKRGITGTVYRAEIDAGWGCMTGGSVPTAVRSHFPSPQVAAAIVGRALALRGGRAVGNGLDLPPARDLLGDLAEVSATNGQHWEPAAAAFVDRWPTAYPAMTPAALSELARAHGVPSVDVKIAGRTVKGYRLDAVRALIAERETYPVG